ncbi:uncharacterized protein LOC111086068 [Limulus polyphemus]|uniref:Uncharacterized protein LOC111086068 n=1 Tax=Limulus polyphemus TaxID=6850 RepID=A0ABM1SHS9_LIMPO|nr:uncharacterized protein LOC111086068 [Limulus polyphemus]
MPLEMLDNDFLFWALIEGKEPSHKICCVFSSDSHPESLKKYLATQAIQNSLLCAKDLGQQHVNKYVEERLMVPVQDDRPKVSIHASIQTLAHFLSEELLPLAPNNKEIVVAGGFRKKFEIRSSKRTTNVTPLRSTHEEDSLSGRDRYLLEHYRKVHIKQRNYEDSFSEDEQENNEGAKLEQLLLDDCSLSQDTDEEDIEMRTKGTHLSPNNPTEYNSLENGHVTTSKNELERSLKSSQKSSKSVMTNGEDSLDLAPSCNGDDANDINRLSPPVHKMTHALSVPTKNVEEQTSLYSENSKADNGRKGIDSHSFNENSGRYFTNGNVTQPVQRFDCNSSDSQTLKNVDDNEKHSSDLIWEKNEDHRYEIMNEKPDSFIIKKCKYEETYNAEHLLPRKMGTIVNLEDKLDSERMITSLDIQDQPHSKKVETLTNIENIHDSDKIETPVNLENKHDYVRMEIVANIEDKLVYQRLETATDEKDKPSSETIKTTSDVEGKPYSESTDTAVNMEDKPYSESTDTAVNMEDKPYSESTDSAVNMEDKSTSEMTGTAINMEDKATSEMAGIADNMEDKSTSEMTRTAVNMEDKPDSEMIEMTVDMEGKPDSEIVGTAVDMEDNLSFEVLETDVNMDDKSDSEMIKMAVDMEGEPDSEMVETTIAKGDESGLQIATTVNVEDKPDFEEIETDAAVKDKPNNERTAITINKEDKLDSVRMEAFTNLNQNSLPEKLEITVDVIKRKENVSQVGAKLKTSNIEESCISERIEQVSTEKFNSNKENVANIGDDIISTNSDSLVNEKNPELTKFDSIKGISESQKSKTENELQCLKLRELDKTVPEEPELLKPVSPICTSKPVTESSTRVEIVEDVSIKNTEQSGSLLTEIHEDSDNDLIPLRIKEVPSGKEKEIPDITDEVFISYANSRIPSGNDLLEWEMIQKEVAEITSMMKSEFVIIKPISPLPSTPPPHPRFDHQYTQSVPEFFVDDGDNQHKADPPHGCYPAKKKKRRKHCEKKFLGQANEIESNTSTTENMQTSEEMEENVDLDENSSRYLSHQQSEGFELSHDIISESTPLEHPKTNHLWNTENLCKHIGNTSLLTGDRSRTSHMLANNQHSSLPSCSNKNMNPSSCTNKIKADILHDSFNSSFKISLQLPDVDKLDHKITAVHLELNTENREFNLTCDQQPSYSNQEGCQNFLRTSYVQKNKSVDNLPAQQVENDLHQHQQPEQADNSKQQRWKFDEPFQTNQWKMDKVVHKQHFKCPEGFTAQVKVPCQEHRESKNRENKTKSLEKPKLSTLNKQYIPNTESEITSDVSSREILNRNKSLPQLQTHEISRTITSPRNILKKRKILRKENIINDSDFFPLKNSVKKISRLSVFKSNMIKASLKGEKNKQSVEINKDNSTSETPLNSTILNNMQFTDKKIYDTKIKDQPNTHLSSKKALDKKSNHKSENFLKPISPLPETPSKIRLASKEQSSESQPEKLCSSSLPKNLCQKFTESKSTRSFTEKRTLELSHNESQKLITSLPNSNSLKSWTDLNSEEGKSILSGVEEVVLKPITEPDFPGNNSTLHGNVLLDSSLETAADSDTRSKSVTKVPEIIIENIPKGSVKQGNAVEVVHTQEEISLSSSKIPSHTNYLDHGKRKCHSDIESEAAKGNCIQISKKMCHGISSLKTFQGSFVLKLSEKEKKCYWKLPHEEMHTSPSIEKCLMKLYSNGKTIEDRNQSRNDFLAIVGNPKVISSVRFLVHSLISYLHNSPKNPFIDFLSQNSKPPIICHLETSLLECLLYLEEKKKKHLRNMMGALMISVKSAVFARKKFNLLFGLAALSRVYAALCRHQGLLEEARIFCYDVLYRNIPFSSFVVAAVVGVWPEVLYSTGEGESSTLREVFGYLILCKPSKLNQTLHKQVSDVLEKLCNLKVNYLDATSLAKHILKDICEQKHQNTVSSSKVFELSKAVELLARREGWEWTNNVLIRELLWPVLQQWSVRSQCLEENKESVNEIKVVFVLKLFGSLCQLCPLKDRENIQGIMVPLQTLLQSEGVSWDILEAAFTSLLYLSSYNNNIVSNVIEKWVPHHLNDFSVEVKKLLEEYQL